MGNELNMYIVINNSTYPHKLNDVENKLSANSFSYETKMMSNEDILKDQVQILRNAYDDKGKNGNNANNVNNNNLIPPVNNNQQNNNLMQNNNLIPPPNIPQNNNLIP